MPSVPLVQRYLQYHQLSQQLQFATLLATGLAIALFSNHKERRMDLTASGAFLGSVAMGNYEGQLPVKNFQIKIFNKFCQITMVL